MRSLLLAGLALLASPSGLHNHLARAEPGVKSEIAQSPAEIRLWFTEPVEVPISTITLMTADSTVLPVLGAVAKGGDAKSFVAPVQKPLAPGRYIVRYKTTGLDGHVVRGRYSFTLVP